MFKRTIGTIAMLALLGALVWTAGPANAGISGPPNGVSATERAGDATRSPLCVDDGTATPISTHTTGTITTVPGTGVAVPPGHCNTQVPELDIIGFSLGRSTTPLKNPAGGDGVYNQLTCPVGTDGLTCTGPATETSSDDPGPGPDGKFGTADDITPSTPSLAGSSVPTIEASWTVNGQLPVENSILDPNGGLLKRGDNEIGTIQLRTAFRAPDLLDNRPTSTCERNTSLPQKKTYALSGMLGHKDDQFFQYVKFLYTLGKSGWSGMPAFGWYTPYDDGGYTYYDFKSNNLLNPWDNSKATEGTVASYTGKGVFWDYSISRTSTTSTATIRVPGVLPSKSNSCYWIKDAVTKWSAATGKDGTKWQYGISSQPMLRTAAQKAADPNYLMDPNFGKVNGIGSNTFRRQATGSATLGTGQNNSDVAQAVYAQSEIATLVTLPVKVPVSDFVAGQNDLESIGGLTGTVDRFDIAGVNQFQGGTTSHNLGISYPFQSGLGCWSATFGGTLPTNPFHTGGQACGIPSPEGDNWLDTLLSFNYGS